MEHRQCKICLINKPKTEEFFYKSGGGGKRKGLNAYKLKASCSCGYSLKRDKERFSTRSLTFHHEHDNKVANISNMMNHSWKKILKEINKCIIICFNCHMALHGKE